MIHEFGQTGRFHKEKGGRREDFTSYHEDQRYVVITLADGMSTCSKSFEGAKIAATALSSFLFEKAEHFFELSDEIVIDYILSHVTYELNKAIKENEGTKLQDYSSTLAGVIFDREEERMITYSLGDSLIIGAGFGRVEILARPSDSINGCPSTTTKGANNLFVINRLDVANYENVIIFTDGAWREIFDKNRLKKDIEAIILDSDYESLDVYFCGIDTFDDCSYIAADLL